MQCTIHVHLRKLALVHMFVHVCVNADAFLEYCRNVLYLWRCVDVYGYVYVYVCVSVDVDVCVCAYACVCLCACMCVSPPK